MTGSDDVKEWRPWWEIQRGLRRAAEGVVRAVRVNSLTEVGFVSGDEKGKTARITGVLGENGVIEEVFGEEIRISYESMPSFGDTLASDQRFWRQPREYLHHHFLRQIGRHSSREPMRCKKMRKTLLKRIGILKLMISPSELDIQSTMENGGRLAERETERERGKKIHKKRIATLAKEFTYNPY